MDEAAVEKAAPRLEAGLTASRVSSRKTIWLMLWHNSRAGSDMIFDFDSAQDAKATQFIARADRTARLARSRLISDNAKSAETRSIICTRHQISSFSDSPDAAAKSQR